MQSFTFYQLIFWLLWSILTPFYMQAQSADPIPFECAGGSDVANGSTSAACPHNADLWLNDARHIPDPNSSAIRVHANFIILRKSNDTNPDVQGNFSQDNAEHMQFLEEFIAACNLNLRQLDQSNTSCEDPAADSKIQIVPNLVFINDEYSWNADNDPSLFKCPSSNWWLKTLDEQISNDPTIPKGINVYLTNQGDIYNRLITLGTIESPENEPDYCKWWCSEGPSTFNLLRGSRIHIPNLYLKYRWFQQQLTQQGVPFSTSRAWLIGDGKRVLAHEFGHSFFGPHYDGCSDHLMNTLGTERNALRKVDVGRMHRYLAISNLRQFVDCTETYHQPNASYNNRVVTEDEIWDLNMRLYSDVVVETGATLTITCQILLPYNGTITVKRGARLVIDGGKVTRANTCSNTQFWQGILVQGNHALPQPAPGALPAPDESGIVELKNNGMIEGAVIGVAAKGHPVWDVPEYRGGLIDVNQFTFLDCRKGVEFMKYDLPNNSRFYRARFERTNKGSMHTGVSIWDTDGILFDYCTFNNLLQTGINAGDATFHVREKNRFTGSVTGIYATATNPLEGHLQIGVPGAFGAVQNLFDKNTVGIRLTGMAQAEIHSNTFKNIDFDIALTGSAQNAITNNDFLGSTAAIQMENTGYQTNETLCNLYNGNLVGNNIIGDNSGFIFREEDFNTQYHDLFIEGTESNPGKIKKHQGSPGNAVYNYFTVGQAENIKTSTVAPNHVTEHFYYYYNNASGNPRVKPLCAANDGSCSPGSNFYLNKTTGTSYSNCQFPQAPQTPLCIDKPCLDSIRNVINQLSGPLNEVQQDLLGELITARESVVNLLVSQYKAVNNWIAIENLLLEDLNPFNWRRLTGAKIMQQQYTAASQVLTDYQTQSIEDEQFKQVQLINIARLSDPQFSLSDAQHLTLQHIADAVSTEAGGAMSLLHVLTGDYFLPQLPALNTERNNTAITLSGQLFVYPNPASEQVNISTRTSEASQIELMALSTGQLIWKQPVEAGLQQWSLSLTDIQPGMYLVVLRNLTTGDCTVNKVSIIH